jgi:hypothetical protein
VKDLEEKDLRNKKVGFTVAIQMELNKGLINSKNKIMSRHY